MISENWLEEILSSDPSAAEHVFPLELDDGQLSGEALVIHEMVFLGEMTQEEGRTLLQELRQRQNK